MTTAHFYCKDHPKANHRKPEPGDREYTLRFPLEDGNEIAVHCGDETFSRFSEMIGSMALDDAADEGAAPGGK